MQADVLKTLNERAARDAIRAIVQASFDEYLDGWAHRDEADADLKRERFFPAGRIYWDLDREPTLYALRQLLDQLPQPVPITAEDVRSELISHLTVVPEQFDSAYPRFLSAIEALAPARRLVIKSSRRRSAVVMRIADQRR